MYDYYDFASRYFAPWVGINEDPVTGIVIINIVCSDQTDERCELAENFYTRRQCSICQKTSWAADYRVWGSVVSSPSGVRGGAPATNAFLAYFRVTEPL